jgi:hypothetical protein
VLCTAPRLTTARHAASLLAALAPMASPSGPSVAAASAAAIKLRDEALAAAQKLTDEAASLHSTNTERSKQLLEDAALLKSVVDAQERVRTAALEKERVQADALELQAAALRDRLRDDTSQAADDGDSSVDSDAAAIPHLHSQAADIQNIKNLIPIVLDL